ncbi:MAG: hypothetical protein KDK97_22165, partial [Verrucomicrobiales bacterium]|nr:hypothetical protein [Verrucomicrobiales bacterium]
FAATGGRSASLLLVQVIGMLVGIMTAAHLGLVISPNIMTLMVGQPVAIGMVWLVKMLGREVSPGIVLRLIAKGPLRFYLGHLVLLQGIAMALR